MIRKKFVDTVNEQKTVYKDFIFYKVRGKVKL